MRRCLGLNWVRSSQLLLSTYYVQSALSCFVLTTTVVWGTSYNYSCYLDEGFEAKRSNLPSSHGQELAKAELELRCSQTALLFPWCHPVRLKVKRGKRVGGDEE